MIKKQKADCPLCFIPLLLGGKKSRKSKSKEKRKSKPKSLKKSVRKSKPKTGIQELIDKKTALITRMAVEHHLPQKKVKELRFKLEEIETKIAELKSVRKSKPKRNKTKLMKFDIKVVLGKNDMEEDIKLRPKPKDWSVQVKKKILNHIKQCVKSFLKYKCQINKRPIIEWKNNNTLSVSVPKIDCAHLNTRANRHVFIIYELQNNEKFYKINGEPWELLISVK